MTATEKAILRAVIYFELFNHPLNGSELFALNGSDARKDDFEQSIARLVEMNLLGKESEYFFLINGGASIKDRIDKLHRSQRYHKISRLISGFIYLHPFVRGVLVSGSLSKSAFSKKDDIDFFIIAKPGRIWICRTILMLFKKIFLLNSKKYFCINYFVDTESLAIPDKNIFTATEIAFLIPLRNSVVCDKFLAANDWIRTYFPNLTVGVSGCSKPSKPLIKTLTERLFKGKLGDRLDSYFMELYRKRSRKKFGLTDQELFSINFKSEKNVAKYHPNGFQGIVMQKYELKISEYQRAHDLDLS